MQVFRAKSFRPNRAWTALDIAEIDGISVRLHWTDQPYQWHVNDGQEVFAVVDGAVDMYYRTDDGEGRKVRLEPGDVFHAAAGDAHVAHPVGEARILVIERKGSL